MTVFARAIRRRDVMCVRFSFNFFFFYRPARVPIQRYYTSYIILFPIVIALVGQRLKLERKKNTVTTTMNGHPTTAAAAVRVCRKTDSELYDRKKTKKR